METIIILALNVFCLWFGWSLRESYAKYKMRKLIQMAEEYEEELQEIDDKYIRIFIEKHNDTFFVYEEKNSRFIVQGNSKEELDKSLREMYPGKLFAITEENLVEIGFAK